MLGRIVSVGGWTLVSRITGFFRDVVIAATMGAGPVADAFVVALRLPNHFRAIFGEGAFNNAFIPTYARVLEAGGAAPARTFADRIFTLMLIVQLAILVPALAVAYLFPTAGHAAAWGVAVAGALELALVWVDARRAGVAPALARP